MRTVMGGEEIAEVLRKAAEYMSEHGKCKGKYRDDDGAVCAHGAVAMVQDAWKTLTGEEGVCYEVPLHTPAQMALQWWVDRFTGEHHVLVWSDSSSAEDVILGLKKAAEYMLETSVTTYVDE